MNSENIRVVLVDPDSEIRRGILLLLDGSDGLTCTATFRSCEEAVARVAAFGADVVLVEPKLLTSSGMESVRLLKKRFPRIKILIHTNFATPDSLDIVRRAGAVGHVSKNSEIKQLVESIRNAYYGLGMLPAINDIPSRHFSSMKSMLKKLL